MAEGPRTVLVAVAHQLPYLACSAVHSIGGLQRSIPVHRQT